MKKVTSVLLWVFIFISPSWAVADEAHRGLNKVAEGVYSYLDEKDPLPSKSFGSNAGIIVGRDGIVVVDTLISSKMAQNFIRDIRAVSDKPIKYVVNTHSHLDHSLGNADFADLGAVIVSHVNCKRSAEAEASTIFQKAKVYGLTDEMLQGTRVKTASLTFTDRMVIDLGDRKAELIYPGPSHTDGSILVYVPDSKTLFAGDVLFTDFHPNMRDGDIPGWIHVLDFISSMDVAAIVPGHGPLSTKKDIQDMKDYLTTCEKMGPELAAEGKGAGYIASEILKTVPKRKYFEMFVSGNVAAKYLSPK